MAVGMSGAGVHQATLLKVMDTCVSRGQLDRAVHEHWHAILHCVGACPGIVRIWLILPELVHGCTLHVRGLL